MDSQAKLEEEPTPRGSVPVQTAQPGVRSRLPSGRGPSAAPASRRVAMSVRAPAASSSPAAGASVPVGTPLPVVTVAAVASPPRDVTPPTTPPAVRPTVAVDSATGGVLSTGSGAGTKSSPPTTGRSQRSKPLISAEPLSPYLRSHRLPPKPNVDYTPGRLQSPSDTFAMSSPARPRSLSFGSPMDARHREVSLPILDNTDARQEFIGEVVYHFSFPEVPASPADIAMHQDQWKMLSFEQKEAKVRQEIFDRLGKESRDRPLMRDDINAALGRMNMDLVATIVSQVDDTVHKPAQGIKLMWRKHCNQMRTIYGAIFRIRRLCGDLPERWNALSDEDKTTWAKIALYAEISNYSRMETESILYSDRFQTGIGWLCRHLSDSHVMPYIAVIGQALEAGLWRKKAPEAARKLVADMVATVNAMLPVKQSTAAPPAPATAVEAKTVANEAVSAAPSPALIFAPPPPSRHSGTMNAYFAILADHKECLRIQNAIVLEFIQHYQTLERWQDEPQQNQHFYIQLGAFLELRKTIQEPEPQKIRPCSNSETDTEVERNPLADRETYEAFTKAFGDWLYQKLFVRNVIEAVTDLLQQKSLTSGPLSHVAVDNSGAAAGAATPLTLPGAAVANTFQPGQQVRQADVSRARSLSV